MGRADAFFPFGSCDDLAIISLSSSGMSSEEGNGAEFVFGALGSCDDLAISLKRLCGRDSDMGVGEADAMCTICLGLPPEETRGSFPVSSRLSGGGADMLVGEANAIFSI